jgi:hypothetical protein
VSAALLLLLLLLVLLVVFAITIRRLFIAEQVVLRLMSFQMRVQQPLKQLLNFCRLLGASKAVAAAAVCLLNDAVAYTQLVLTQDAAVLAAGALQLAWQLMQQQQQQHGGAAHQEVSSKAAASDLQETAVLAGRASWEVHSGLQEQRNRHREHERSISRDALHRQRHSAADSESRGRHRLPFYDHHHGDDSRRGVRQRSSSSRSVGGHLAVAAAGDAALRDGSWLAAVGLQQSEVAEVQQALHELVRLQEPQQQRAC